MGLRRYQTTAYRAAVALFAGAGVTSALTAITVIVNIRLAGPTARGAQLAEFPGVLMFMLEFIYIFYIFCAIGLTVIATPVWWLLHKIGRRSWIDAVVLGGALCFGTVLIMSRPGSPQSRPPWQNSSGDYTLIHPAPAKPERSRIVLWDVPFGLTGAIAGFVIWRIAYRKIPEVPAFEAASSGPEAKKTPGG